MCKSYSQVMNKIVEKPNHWITFPITVELNLTKETLAARFWIPTTISALDRTNIEQTKSVHG